MLKIINQLGFTLIELMVTIAVAAILLTIGVPSLTSLYESSRAGSEIQKINDAFLFARNQAINYGSTVTICPYAASTCGTDWNKGFNIYLDNGVNKSLLKVIDSVNNNDTIKISGPTGKKINFMPDGLVSNDTLVIYCAGGKSTNSRSINISTSGLIKSGDKGLSC